MAYGGCATATGENISGKGIDDVFMNMIAERCCGNVEGRALKGREGWRMVEGKSEVYRMLYQY